MRTRVLRVLFLIVAAPLPFVLLGGGQPTDPHPPGPAPAAAPAKAPEAPAKAPQTLPPSVTRAAPPRDLSHLTPLQKQMLLSARRGAEWLWRMNEDKGRFSPGVIPALRQEIEGDHFLRQAGATCALARAARFTGEQRWEARAVQAVLTLLEETTLDPKDPTVRYTSLPPVAVNRLAAAGLLVLAIHELPAPQADVLEKSDQLCNYIRRCARPDGSLALVEGEDARAEDEESVGPYTGLALCGLACSTRHRPAPWKADVVRNAARYYRGWWKAHQKLTFVLYHVAACSEAYALTHDKELADFAFEMSDWLAGLQYVQINPRHLLWYGGFMGYAEGRPVEVAPTIASASCAEALAEACRIARQSGDLARYQRYSEGVERCLQFLTTLQYTEATTTHFADWYRPRLLGAFHASHQDGNLRIDYTQQAVCALLGYLEHVGH